jgi:hypothetical protein
MDELWRNALIRKYGEVIDALGHHVRDCPDELWEESVWPVTRNQPWVWPIRRFGQKEFPTEAEQLQLLPVISAFWNVAYHAIFHLDFYLSGGDLPYRPPAPFREEEHRSGTVPARTYSRDELLGYLAHCGAKSLDTITGLQAEEAARITRVGEPFIDVLHWGLAHAQEHQAQFGLWFGQRGVKSNSWSNAQLLRNRIRHRTDAEVDAAVQALGGYTRLLPQVVAGLAASLAPAREGSVAFDLGTRHTITAKGGVAKADKTAKSQVTATIAMSAHDFLRMASRHETFEALKSGGRVTLSGDSEAIAALLRTR